MILIILVLLSETSYFQKSNTFSKKKDSSHWDILMVYSNVCKLFQKRNSRNVSVMAALLEEKNNLKFIEPLPCARYHGSWFHKLWIFVTTLQGRHYILITQMRELRLREGKGLAQGHNVTKW